MDYTIPSSVSRYLSEFSEACLRIKTTCRAHGVDSGDLRATMSDKTAEILGLKHGDRVFTAIVDVHPKHSDDVIISSIQHYYLGWVRLVIK